MNLAKVKMRPIRIPPDGKSEIRTQFGALCWRVRGDKVQVLLITSRRTGRWIIPKGWPIDGATPAEAAAQEAWEEAGVEGKVMGNALGIYSYVKQSEPDSLPLVVAVFAVKVKAIRSRYPEADLRKRKWVSLKKAASLVAEPELRQIIRDFDQRLGLR